MTSISNFQFVWKCPTLYISEESLPAAEFRVDNLGLPSLSRTLSLWVLKETKFLMVPLSLVRHESHLLLLFLVAFLGLSVDPDKVNCECAVNVSCTELFRVP